MALLRYVSHPEVDHDPTVPVPQWCLSDRGRERVTALLSQPWLAGIGQVVSSAETKAVETARIVACRLNLTIDVRPTTGEIDRSATGFVPPARHDELADRLFAEPTRSADGWERAIDAQARVAQALADLLVPAYSPATRSAPDSTPDKKSISVADVMVVGHGGVGTLLYARLAGLPIDRRHDQPGQGHYWSYDRDSAAVVHPWRPIDDF